jgi:hypothetical protein
LLNPGPQHVPEFPFPEKQIEKVSDLASGTQHQDVSFAFRMVSVPAVAAHPEPAPFASDGMQLADVLEFFRHVSGLL